MPRIMYVLLFLIVAAIPFVFFSMVSNTVTGTGNAYRSGYSSRGPSFFFLDLDFDRSSRGKGYSSGSYQGGGFRAGGK